jgi:molybdenum cofactor cytidylyltransferase
MNAPSPERHRLEAIVLAAGGSRRLGRAKQLVRIVGEPMVRAAARLALHVCPGRVTVVTGASRTGVESALEDLPVFLVHNAGWRRGLSTSLTTGLASLPADAAGVLVVSCDQPRVRNRDLERLVTAWSRRPERPAAAAYAGTAGIPAVLTPELCVRARRLQGDLGAAAMLRAEPGLQRIPMPGAAQDLDDETDLWRLSAGAPAARATAAESTRG